jgi:hypothetical protein
MVTVKIVKSPAYKVLEDAINTISKKVGKVGWFEGAKYKDKKQTQAAYVAAINEFGSPGQNIPARPFMRPTIHTKGNEWVALAQKGYKSVINGKLTPDGLMEIVGQKAKSDIQKTIEALWSPALSHATIQARMSKYSNDTKLAASTRKKRKKDFQKFVSAGFYKPLEDTGYMLTSIINVVENE